jgi:GDP-L-fucose synthase
MKKDSKIWVAGHRGLVGSALLRLLEAEGYTNVVTCPIDLREQTKTVEWIQWSSPSYIFLAAAKVGGILANSTKPADFIFDNALIEANVLLGAHQANVEKVLFLGSSCIYPRDAPQPITEECLLSGPLEETNRAYALAKITGIEMVRALRKQYGRPYICAMPTNLYGPNDNFHPENSHVIPGMITKFWAARQARKPAIEMWGTGTPMREFLHVDDLARALVMLMNEYDGDIINVGSGQEVSIRDLAEIVRRACGYHGLVHWDESKPDGTPRKLLDSSRIFAMGWEPQIPLEKGLRDTSLWYEKNLLRSN